MLDTACTQHSAPEELDSGWGSDYVKVEGETLCVANGTELEVIGRGSRMICANPPIIQEFIHVRGLKKVLISVSQLIREYNNLVMYVYAFGCVLQFPNNITVNVLMNKGLYPLAMPARDHGVEPSILRVNGQVDKGNSSSSNTTTNVSTNLQCRTNEDDMMVSSDLFSVSHDDGIC